MTDLSLEPEVIARLRTLGANDADISELSVGASQLHRSDRRLTVARVARVERRTLNLLLSPGERRIAVQSDKVVAVVGDWVIATSTNNERPEVTYISTRRTSILRRSNDSRATAQVLAANVDNVVITVGADQRLSLPRLERMLAIAWESGADPVLALSKCDLLSTIDLRTLRSNIDSVALDVPVVTTSALSHVGIDDLLEAVHPGGTLVFLGSSGAGKSTFVNALIGTEVAMTSGLRTADGKGRHTTAWRELIALPNGGAVIDTPGLRQLGLWSNAGGVASAFSDIEEVAAHCRFSDCSHHGEPGCAVETALIHGSLDRRRFEHYEKLLLEASHIKERFDILSARSQQRIGTMRPKEGRLKKRQREEEEEEGDDDDDE